MSRQDNLSHLLCMQRADVPDIGLYGKLTFEDLKRIDLAISGDITKSFDCCLYNGATIGNYCTFSYRGKKTSLLRMLHHNLVEDIKPDMRVKHTCQNKGICCNLSHFNMICEEASEIEENSESERESDADEEIFHFSE